MAFMGVKHEVKRSKGEDILRVAPPRHKLPFCVREPDGCVGEGFADCD